MNSRRMEFFIGMMVIGIVIGVFVMTLLFRSESGFFVGGNHGRRMNIEFKNGAGISQNSLVMKSGIKIGRVYSVVLLDEVNDSRVRVAFELEPEANIYSNEIAKINRTFLGDASIGIVDNPDYDEERDGPIVALGPDANLKSTKTADIMNTVSSLEGDLGAALQNINTATAGITTFMNSVNEFLGDKDERQIKADRIKSIFDELNGTLVSIRGLASHMDEVVSDENLKANILEATDKIPAIMARVEEISSKASVFMDNASSMSDDVRKTLSRADTTFDLVDKNLDNINVFTTALADNGPEMMTSLNEGAAEIKGAIDEVKGAIENIASFVGNLNEKLDDPDSPIGMLSDSEIGAEIRNIVANIEELTEKAYPIMDDARVFSNKIAHKPSSLIWDKNQTKGGTLSEKFGWQPKSPTGGVSSALYRQTPSGEKICQRNYYRPLADVDFMDSKTRAVYENEVLKRETLRGEGSYDDYAGAYADYANVVPAGPAADANGFCAAVKEKTNRIRWSLDSFFGRFSPNRRAAQELEYAQYADDGVNMVGYEAYPGAYDYVDQAGYAQYQDAYVDGAYMDGAYFDGGLADDYGYQTTYAPNDCYAPTSECGVPSCGVPSCDVPTCDTPNCGVPSCDVPGCDAPNCAANGTNALRTTTGAGYQGGSLGPYQAEQPSAMEEADAADAEEIEELPSSINRRVDANAFEDDGLPMQIAPPTRSR